MQVTEKAVKLIEIRFYVRCKVSFWCLCMIQKMAKLPKMYLPWCLSPFMNFSTVHLCKEEMLHLSGKSKVFFIKTEKLIPNKTWRSKKGSNLCNFVLPFGLCLIHEPSAEILFCSSQSCHDEQYLPLQKEFEIITVLLFCVLQADFKLMCDNAMTYNRPDTVYYKLAKKILHTGFKMMSKVRDLLKTKSRNSMQVFLLYLKGLINYKDKCYFIYLW